MMTQKLQLPFPVRILSAKAQNFKLEYERIMSRKSSYFLGYLDEIIPIDSEEITIIAKRQNLDV